MICTYHIDIIMSTQFYDDRCIRLSERKLATPAEIAGALAAARKAQAAWKRVAVEVRQTLLSRAVDAFVGKKDEIAEEITRQIGRPLGQSPGEVRGFEERARAMIGIAPVALGNFEAENAAIEREGAVEVGDLEVDVADARAGVDGAGIRRHAEVSHRRGRCRAFLFVALNDAWAVLLRYPGIKVIGSPYSHLRASVPWCACFKINSTIGVGSTRLWGWCPTPGLLMISMEPPKAR